MSGATRIGLWFLVAAVLCGCQTRGGDAFIGDNEDRGSLDGIVLIEPTTVVIDVGTCVDDVRSIWAFGSPIPCENPGAALEIVRYVGPRFLGVLPQSTESACRPGEIELVEEADNNTVGQIWCAVEL